MMILKEVFPSQHLIEFVRLYRIIDFNFPDSSPIPSKAYPPRPEHCLQFAPTPTSMVYPGESSAFKPKNAFLAGQHTLITNRTVYQKFLAVQVIFQPGALYRLLGIPLNELTNQIIEADEFFGKDIAFVNDQLYHASNHAEMVMIIERFMSDRIKKLKKDSHPIDGLIHYMYKRNSSQSLDWFIDGSCLSHRQFDRKFLERTGIAAKEFMRVIRFYEAYLLKNKFPEHDWLTVALECGYYDYQHLSKDYKEFTGYTPKQFFALDSPERTLGSEEVYD